MAPHEIKTKAIAARDYLSSLVQNKDQLVYYINCGKFDKYSRILGTIFEQK